MKVIVKEAFLDKFDQKKAYKPGEILDWDDEDRIRDCKDRGLIERAKEQETDDGAAEEKAAPKKSGKKKKQ